VVDLLDLAEPPAVDLLDRTGLLAVGLLLGRTGLLVADLLLDLMALLAPGPLPAPADPLVPALPAPADLLVRAPGGLSSIHPHQRSEPRQ
jgi:hypothetical protein